ncbi:aldo/keto reductase [Actinosynnema pretiosum subsp. pretiosum]|uniref:Aldo/keto reductase n=2 Tax=Actinosynnema TaxID=40566 RepID=C6WID3_ACTMD|nr:aldo/keto reductase [Actinosynnema mirum]ACU36176.1 aldo/keto reductase [Actinosynnema mirum DSM 43827]AXX29633.1 L-fuco-beta-pyranose dehydrogenase [Actinosynnema pretiosum subsp. pretiosum]QUF06140.1 aldo/keto reductase [Actinosynnema pretiosum subsp. pretiosum]
MSEFALGLAALGRPAYINLGRDGALPATRDVDSLRAACHAVLDAAHAAGVRRVDAARSYGLSESFLSEWLADRGHDDVVVSSKWGYAYVADWRADADVHEVKEHSLQRFTRQWEETAALIEPSRYLVHSLTADSPLFDDPALLDALGALRTRDVKVGFSTTGPRQADTIRRALALEVDGQPLFTVVQSTWNALERAAGQALAEASAAGFEVYVKEGVANGRLAVQPPAALQDLARELGATPDAAALALVAAQPWADVVLSGAASTDQLRANLRAAELDVPADALDELVEPAEQYWSTRGSLAWT